MQTVLIVQDGTPLLREIAKPLPKDLFGSKELKSMLADMEAALDKEPDGVALAAPQISIPYRIFVVRYDRILPLPEAGEPVHSVDIGVYINPEIQKTSRRKKVMNEGCLSVRNMYGKTKRYERATVMAYDEKGNAFTRGGGGVLAQIFQHETDHLNGILFTDHAENVNEILPENAKG
jgi:peptide deformylase